jgi:hypothetical protein
MHSSVAGHPVQIAQLVQPEAQQQQYRQLQPFQGLLHQLFQVMIKGPLAAQHAEDQLGKQATVRSLQLVAGQLLIDQIIGVQVTAGQPLQGRIGGLAG